MRASFVFYRFQNLTATLPQALPAAGAAIFSYADNFILPMYMAANAACQSKHN
jgi:hypothetical protein